MDSILQQEGFSIRTEDLEKFLHFSKVLLEQRLDFKRKFEVVMENDPAKPSTEFKFKYTD